jgi:hypothetical protein
VGALEDLDIRLRASGAAVPIAAYPHSQTARGVRVRINKGGAGRLISSAFVQTMPRTGHRGVFRRLGESRYPIKELTSSTVADTLRDEAVPEEVLQAAAKKFNETFGRVVTRSVGAP